MILAAAIQITRKSTNNTVVLCGARHGNIFDQMTLLGIKHDDITEEIEGFIDHKNTFLTRKEAYEHAKMCGQLCDKIIYERENGGVGGTNLISEDLW